MCKNYRIIELFQIIISKCYICSMDIRQAIRSYANQPLTHAVMLSLLNDYKRPNDKLHHLIREGVLEPLKKGLYIAGPLLQAGKPEPFLVANHLLGPSYVSVDAALSYYGLIPERVYEVSSMTTKTARVFQTPMGMFTYTHLGLPYYAFGIRQAKLADEQYALVASPEKALFDKVITTSGLMLRSWKSATDYLLENLRMDEGMLKKLDSKTMSMWIQDAPKKDSLEMVIKTIKNL